MSPRPRELSLLLALASSFISSVGMAEAPAPEGSSAAGLAEPPTQLPAGPAQPATEPPSGSAAGGPGIAPAPHKAPRTPALSELDKIRNENDRVPLARRSTAGIAALEAWYIGERSPDEIRSLSPGQLSALRPEQARALDASQLEGLSAEQLQALQRLVGEPTLGEGSAVQIRVKKALERRRRIDAWQPGVRLIVDGYGQFGAGGETGSAQAAFGVGVEFRALNAYAALVLRKGTQPTTLTDARDQGESLIVPQTQAVSVGFEGHAAWYDSIGFSIGAQLQLDAGLADWSTSVADREAPARTPSSTGTSTAAGNSAMP